MSPAVSPGYRQRVGKDRAAERGGSLAMPWVWLCASQEHNAQLPATRVGQVRDISISRRRDRVGEADLATRARPRPALRMLISGACRRVPAHPLDNSVRLCFRPLEESP